MFLKKMIIAVVLEPEPEPEEGVVLKFIDGYTPPDGDDVDLKFEEE